LNNFDSSSFADYRNSKRISLTCKF